MGLGMGLGGARAWAGGEDGPDGLGGADVMRSFGGWMDDEREDGVGEVGRAGFFEGLAECDGSLEHGTGKAGFLSLSEGLSLRGTCCSISTDAAAWISIFRSRSEVSELLAAREVSRGELIDPIGSLDRPGA